MPLQDGRAVPTPRLRTGDSEAIIEMAWNKYEWLMTCLKELHLPCEAPFGACAGSGCRVAEPKSLLRAAATPAAAAFLLPHLALHHRGLLFFSKAFRRVRPGLASTSPYPATLSTGSAAALALLESPYSSPYVSSRHLAAGHAREPDMKDLGAPNGCRQWPGGTDDSCASTSVPHDLARPVEC